MKKVLLLDAEPQCDLTFCFGYYNQENIKTIANLIDNCINERQLDVESTILHSKDNIALMLSNLDLSTMEIPLMSAMNREFAFKNFFK